MRWGFLLLFFLTPLAAASPSGFIHGDLADVHWTDRDGTTHIGINGSGQYIVQTEAYNADGHPAMANCYGRSVHHVGVAREGGTDPATATDPNNHGSLTSAAICAHWEEAGTELDGVAVGARLLTVSQIYPNLQGRNETETQWELQREHQPKIVTSSHARSSDPGEITGNRWAPFAAGQDMVHLLAIGNEGPQASPPREKDNRTIVVGALSWDGRAVASYSSTGTADESTWPDLMAPGCMFLPTDATGPGSAAISTYNEQVGERIARTGNCPEPSLEVAAHAHRHGYFLQPGTSFATPVVAGVAALALEVGPGLGGATIAEVLRQTADPFLPTPDLDGDGTITPSEFRAKHGAEAGYGRVNATRAVMVAHYMGTFDAPLTEALECAHMADRTLNPRGPCIAPETPTQTVPAPAPAARATTSTEPEQKHSPAPLPILVFALWGLARRT